MTDNAEKALNELRTSVSTLEKDVASLEQEKDANEEDQKKKVREISERITQGLIALDGVDVSKESATEAFKDGDRKTVMKLSVLLTRRKGLVRKLNALGERVDKIGE